jgi:hypothetical protein
MTVLQLIHENVSKFVPCACDLLLIIASPQRDNAESGAVAEVASGPRYGATCSVHVFAGQPNTTWRQKCRKH